MRIKYLLCLLMPLLLLAPACKRDKCKRVTCVHGTCADGTCICEAGYFGVDCGDALNTGFSGGWAVDENCTAGVDAYNLTFGADDADKAKVWLLGLWETQDTLTANIGSDGLSLSLSRQRLGAYEVDGSGTVDLQHTEIQLNYRVFTIGNSTAFDQCTAYLSKN